MKKNRLIVLLACFMTAVVCMFAGCQETPQSESKTELTIEDMGAGESVAPEESGDKIEEKELPTLDVPSAVYYDTATGILSWNSNANATAGWNVTISQSETVCLQKNVTAPSIALTTLSVGTYTAELKANEVTNAFRASASVFYTFSIFGTVVDGTVTEKMPQPSTFAYEAENDLLVWEDVEGNNGYELEIYNGTTQVMQYNGTRAYASMMDLPLGEYTAKLIVSGDGVTVNDSDEKTLSFSISSWGKLNAPDNLRLVDGMLVWDSVSYTSGIDVQLLDYATNESVQATYVVENGNKLSIAELGVEEGNYKIRLAWESNRHDQDVSAYAEYGFSIEYAASYTPNDIVNFDGSLPKGEHGGARLVTEKGVKYAAIYPTKDGWGRLAGPEFTLDFD